MHDFPAPAYVTFVGGKTVLMPSFRLFPKYDYSKIYADCEPYHGKVSAAAVVLYAHASPQVNTGRHTKAMVSTKRRVPCS